MEVDNVEKERGRNKRSLMDQPKTAEVLHMLQKIKTLATTSTDTKLIKCYDHVYQKVQEMFIKEKIQTSIKNILNEWY